MGPRYVAPPLPAARVFSGYIPGGYAGTVNTAQRVKALIRDGARDFYVRQKAIDILLERGVRAKDYLGEIDALFRWVQRNVRYTKDPYRVEVLHAARRMLELRAGDCDDMTTVLGAMLQAIGHPVRLVLAGPDLLRPRLFSHIYLEVFHQGRWIPLDATMPYPMGWAPQSPVKEVHTIAEEADHAVRRPGVAGLGRCPHCGAGLAAGVDPRPAGREDPAPGRAREVPLGSAPAARPAGPQPADARAAAQDVAARAAGAPATAHHAPGRAGAAPVGRAAAAGGAPRGRALGDAAPLAGEGGPPGGAAAACACGRHAAVTGRAAEADRLLLGDDGTLYEVVR
jgi:hypothetical protein